MQIRRSKTAKDRNGCGLCGLWRWTIEKAHFTGTLPKTANHSMLAVFAVRPVRSARKPRKAKFERDSRSHLLMHDIARAFV